MFHKKVFSGKMFFFLHTCSFPALKKNLFGGIEYFFKLPITRVFLWSDNFTLWLGRMRRGQQAGDAVHNRRVWQGGGSGYHQGTLAAKRARAWRYVIRLRHSLLQSVLWKSYFSVYWCFFCSVATSVVFCDIISPKSFVQKLQII